MSSTAIPERTPWGLVVLLGSLTAMGALSIDMYLPGLPSIGADLHTSASQAQATVAAFLAGMAVGQIVYGPASDRVGRKPPILFGVTIYVLASVACALATSPVMLISARFVQALGACAGAVVARAAIRDRFNHTETARMLSLMMLINGMAPILAPVVGGVLVTVSGWRVTFWVMTAFGLTVGTAALLRMRESRSAATLAQAQSESALRAYLALLRQPRLIGYALAGALNGATLFTYISTSPELLIKTYGVPPWAFGLIFGTNALGLISSGQINRLLLRRQTPDAVLARAGLVAVGFAVLLAIFAFTGIGGRWTVLPTLFCILATYGFMQGNTMAGALSVDPTRAGSASALMGGCTFTIGALASAAAGALHDGTPRPLAFVLLVSLIGSALAIRLLALPKAPLP